MSHDLRPYFKLMCANQHPITLLHERRKYTVTYGGKCLSTKMELRNILKSTSINLHDLTSCKVQ